VAVARGWWLLLPACVVLPVRATAQSTTLDPDLEEPRWFRAWSPLLWRGDLTRRIPSLGSGFQPDTARTGEFWTAGNPAGLVREVDAGRTDFTFGWTREQGDYRRPLDAGAARLIRLRARSWQRISPSFALIGNVIADQERLEPGTLSAQTEAHTSSPFVLTDTSNAGMRRTRVRLEGAGAWGVGAWGLGIALGLDVRDNQTLESGFVRRGRGAVPGAVLGVSRRLGSAAVGAYGRYRFRNETIRLSESAAEGRIYPLEGYREPKRNDLIEGYYRRIEESSPSVGVSARTLLLGGTAAGFAEARWLTETQTSQETADPAQDRWSMDGWSAGFSWQRPLGSRWRVEVSGEGESLVGEADAYFDEVGVFFTTNERRYAARGALRYAHEDWQLALGGSLRHERRVRNDSSALVGSSISATSPGIEGSAGRRFGPVTVTLSGGLHYYAPTSTLPSPAEDGPKYQQLIAPELDLYAIPSRPYMGAIRIDWLVAANSVIWLLARTENSSPTDGPLTSFSPSGSRSMSAVEGGLRLERR
jgi:hypothetical protein